MSTVFREREREVQIKMEGEGEEEEEKENEGRRHCGKIEELASLWMKFQMTYIYRDEMHILAMN
uniref:Uncharacterized protein n=1 Tax=Medicago truncatula TaxID=3880 RepID=Q2HT90_MEDTR|nr:hypothetical protein MtrDRAFT_AC150776g16v2 [Medicago truncatula]